MKIKYKPFDSYYYDNKSLLSDTIDLQTEYFKISPTAWQQFKDWIIKICFNGEPKYQGYADKITDLIETEYNRSFNKTTDVLYHQHTNDIHYIIANSNTIKTLIKDGIEDDYLDQRVDLIMFHMRAKVCWLAMKSNDPRGIHMYKNQSTYETFMNKWNNN